MPRKMAVTDEEFRNCHRTARNVQDICNRLRLSGVTVYNYLKRLGLIAPKRDISAACDKVFRAYQGRASMAEVAHKLHMPLASVRYYLSRAIIAHWTKKGSIWPMPTKLRYLKVVHELEKFPALFDNPRVLSVNTGIKLEYVMDYLDSVGNANDRIKRGGPLENYKPSKTKRSGSYNIAK